jgi:hypothetical protein
MRIAALPLLLVMTGLGCASQRVSTVARKSIVTQEPSEPAPERPFGILRVNVVDDNDKPLPGAIVRIMYLSPGERLFKAVEGDEHGTGTISFLHAGNYQLTAMMDGFATAISEKIVVRTGEISHAKITLQPGSENICLDSCGDPCWGLTTIDLSSSSSITRIPIECYRNQFAW